MSTATSPAARLARTINEYVATGSMGGGFVIASPDGSSGVWHSAGSQPRLDRGDFTVTIGSRRMSVARAQRLIDEAAADTAELDAE